MINIMLTLEYSIIILLIYTLIRSTARKEFGGEDKPYGIIIIVFALGIYIYIYINNIPGLLIIIAGITLIVIPDKKDKNKLKEI